MTFLVSGKIFSQQTMPAGQFSQLGGSCKAFSLESPTIVNTSQIHSAIVATDINHDGIPDAIVSIPGLDQFGVVGVFLGNNDGTLQPQFDLPAVASPQGLAVGDFNRDGETDIAVASKFDQAVKIFVGDGTGNFAAAGSYSTPGNTMKVATADFNNDGWLDLVVASSSVQVLFGSDGGFSTGPTYSLPVQANNVATGYFNNDALADFAVAYSGDVADGRVQAYLATGNGQFTLSVDISDATAFRTVETGDFNSDGKTDILTMGRTNSSDPARLIVLLGDGNGAFNALPPAFAASRGDSAVGDFNGDGILDFATSEGSIYIGAGNGTFELSDGLAAVVFPVDIATADFDGDGNLDLIQANEWRSRLYLYKGFGNGRFPAPNSLPALDDSVAADFNLDGRLDVASMTGNGTTYVHIQQPNGTFSNLGDGAIFYSGTSTVTNANSIVSEDFNRDGFPDLAFSVAVFNQIVIMLNGGGDHFTTTTVALTSLSSYPDTVRAGNFNGDTFVDLAVLNRGIQTSAKYTILIGDGNGGFTVRPEQQTLVSGSRNSLAVADIDEDGKQDLLVGVNNNNLYIYKGNGNGTFATRQTIPLSSPAGAVQSADFNSDGRSDIAVLTANSSGSSFLRLLNNGGGTFSTAVYSAPGGYDAAIVFDDFDRDGHKDVILGGTGDALNTAGFLRGDGLGNFAPAQAFENFGGKPFSSADFNNDGLQDYAAIGALYLNNAINDPCFSIGDVSVPELETNVNANFSINLSAVSTSAVSVDYQVIGRNAQSGADFAKTSGTAMFPPGITSQPVVVPILGDSLDEADEVFNIQLSNPVNAWIDDPQGTGTITDNDAAPNVSISDSATQEGSGGTSQIPLVVSLSGPSGRLIKLHAATQNGTATAPADFTSVSRAFPIEPGTVSKNFVVPLVPDTLIEPDENFTVVLTNPQFVTITDGQGTGNILNDDWAISGTISYGNAIGAPIPRFVSNVTLTGGGSPNVMTTSGAPGPNAGQYALSGFGTEAYTVTPTKTGGINASISSFDAAKIAQHVAGTVLLTGNQLIVADVSGNGTLSSFDAGQIARYVASVPGSGSTGNWRFNPANRMYASITTNITGEDYSGLLMGEVSGNWNNTGARPVNSKQLTVGGGPERGVAVELPDIEAAADKEIIVPVNIRGVANKGVISYEFDLRYDPSVMQPLSEPVDLKGTVSRGLFVATNSHEPGLLRVVVYGPMPLNDDGVLLNLRFTAVGKPGSVSPLTFERIIFNEGEPRVITADGQIELF